MRTEIIILLIAGFKPAVVSKILNIPLDTIYYNNRELNKGYAVIRKLDTKGIHNRLKVV